MYENILIGSTNEHLLKSIKYNIPIIILKYDYFEFENYVTPIVIDGHKELDVDLEITRKKVAFSKLAIREKILFFLELKGLLVEKNVKNVILNSREKTITIYKEKSFKKVLEYKILNLLDSSTTSFDSDITTFGNVGLNQIIDVYKFPKEKEVKLYIPTPKLDPIRELYYYNQNLYCVSRIHTDDLDNFETSQVYLKNIFENFLKKEFNINIPIKASPCQRVIRPLFYRRLVVERSEIKYELS